MKNWKETTLGEVAKIKGGKRLPLGSALQLEKTDHPYIKVTNLTGNAINGVDEYVADTVFERIRKYTVDSGDIVLSIVGTIGLVGKIPEYLHKASLTENCVKIIPNENLDRDYLFYYLSSRIGQSEIVKNTIGAVQLKLPIYGVQNINLLLPPLEEQKEIAGILGSLDDKIELLREENKTLEATAQTIFKEWFVNFNFPNAEGKPYKSAGGKMIDSELGLIPDGWRVVSLYGAVQVMGGGTPKTDVPEYWNGKIPFFTPKDVASSSFVLSTEKTITEKGVDICNSIVFPRETVFITARGTIGKVAMVGEPMAMNQSCYALKVGKEMKEVFGQHFVLELMRHISEELQKSSHGSVFETITTRTFQSVYTVIPDKNMGNEFEGISRSLHQKAIDNMHQIQTISTLRDTLLPKLMTGGIE